MKITKLQSLMTAFLYILAFSCATQAGQPEPASGNSQFSKVLGTDASQWTITPPAAAQLSDQAPAALYSSAPQGLILENNTNYPAETDYSAVCRLHPDAGKSASVTMYVACSPVPAAAPAQPPAGAASPVKAASPAKAVTPVKAPTAGIAPGMPCVKLLVSCVGGQDFVNYSFSVQSKGVTATLRAPALAGPKGSRQAIEAAAQAKRFNPIAGRFELARATEYNLAWPEDFRRIIEAQIASAPKMEEINFILRCRVEPDHIRVWVNGRLLGDLPLPDDMTGAGTFKIQLTSASRLLSTEAGAVPATDPRFIPIYLDGNLTGSMIAGKKINHVSLPSAGKQTMIDGLPFYFPKPDGSGNDHIDVGTSWTRFGELSGYFSAQAGAFGGRWTGADHLDPDRIAMYVPRGQYKALHIIAAADGEPDKTPVVTAQFYRPNSGHPANFPAQVPELKAQSAAAGAIPVKLAGGGTGHLYHVVIPLDPAAFDWFSDLNRIGLEITKQVQFYRAYPDPLEYSWHGAGLPSGVHIYAMTLERAAADVSIEPDQVGHVWTAPEKPGYTITLRNNGSAATSAKIEVSTRSCDGGDSSSESRTVALPASGEAVSVHIPLNPSLYGLHELTAVCTVNGETVTRLRDFAYLHPDTRERGDWAEGKGAIFGYWSWGGAHDTPNKKAEITVMGEAGAETSTEPYGSDPDPDVQALAEKYHIVSHQAFTYAATFYGGFAFGLSAKFNPDDPVGTGQVLIDKLKSVQIAPGPLNIPTYMPFFPEPDFAGDLAFAIYPSHYNGPDYVFTPAVEKAYQSYLSRFLIGAAAVRKEWPDLKLLVPYGDPMNTAVFLQRSPETRSLVDGIALDLPNFERLPEQQVGQVTLNRLCPILDDVRKYLKNPYLVMIEGPSIIGDAKDTSEREKGDIEIRDFLVLLGYGIYQHASANAPFDCADAWGENHYGGGYMSREPVSTPQIGYVAYATLTRHLNRANFTKYVPTGSTSVYCEQFKHYKSGKLIHVFWTIRGKRPVSLKVASGVTVELYDQNDNVTALKEKDGAVTFAIGSSPCYLEGLPADAEITLGESDHGDSAPSDDSTQIADLGDGSWKLVAKEDLDYAKNKPLQVERFLGKMSAQSVDAPAAQGGKALAIHLEKQDIDRGVMPFYTTFEPASPITIPGKASYLGLWVHAASDWGRVVYVLRDAKGAKWISVGTKEEWNNDDIHCWSSFCFDGWRYLKFELPSSAPYDCYREGGTSWWGSYGGDGVVELPLKLEKIIVERRPEVVYGNALVPAKPDDVLLGSLHAEYAQPGDKGADVVKLSKLRMPVPAGAPELSNPIADLAATGVGAPVSVDGVTPPAEQADGTSCTVDFTPAPAAKSYDIWVSAYPDGRGALHLGKGWTAPGKLIRGLRPNTPFYVFVVYTDDAGKLSKPSGPYKFTLSDQFNYK